jgi:hypothetical protein
MLHFLQPAATLFIGLALSVYGLIQSIWHTPSIAAFQTAAQAMPDAVAVLVFGLGIAAIIVGIFLLITGVKGVRGRYRDIDRAYGRPHPRNDRHRDERNGYSYDDWDDHPAYR